MSQELHYTSVARGLRPGSRGFGTVAATANLPETLADRLEALSAYQAVFPPGDPSEALNPVTYVHVRLAGGGAPREVVGRIGPAGLDYSGRPNKYAHHVILEPGECPEGGPAWLMTQPGFLRDAWEGEPRTIDAGPDVPRGDRPPRIARAWQARTGDAGWAGVLAETFLADPRRPVFLVFRPGMELLPLFGEALALLPPSRRWDVSFSTYLTTLPPGISCNWRGVLDGTPQAKSARRLPDALILDLGRPLGTASGGGLVHLARTGERLDIPDAVAPAPSGASREARRPPAITAGPPPSPEPGNDGPAHREWLPDLAAQLSVDQSLLGDDRVGRLSARDRRAVIAVLAALGLLLMLGTLVLVSPSLRRRIGIESPKVARVTQSRPRPVEPVRPERRLVKKEMAPPDKSAEVPEKAVAAAGPPPDELIPPDLKPTVPTVPTPPAPTTPSKPLILAFETPGVVRSALFGKTRKVDPAIALPEDTEDRFDLLNAPDFRPPARSGVPPAWEITTRSSSGIGGGVTLARLTRADARTWRFHWTERARTQTSQVEALRDAVLRFRGQDGRPIDVLLRGIERDRDIPLVAWDNLKILNDKLDTRTRTVEWAGKAVTMEGSRWKPRIRRWKLSITRAGDIKDNDRVIDRVFEPDPVDPEHSGDDPATERALVPGELTLKLSIDPKRPGTIKVQIKTMPDRILEGHASRAARRAELANVTPRDPDGALQDPVAYRRDQIRKLRDEDAKDPLAIADLEREIAELEEIAAIRELEDLLAGPSRAELSVVIGLDVEGAGLLEVARIGEFADGR